VPLSAIQKGRVGEWLLKAAATFTSEGELQFFDVATDDAGIDLSVRTKSSMRTLYLQVKTPLSVDSEGRLSFSFPVRGSPPSDPSLVYAIVHPVAPSQIAACWLIPSAVLNSQLVNSDGQWHFKCSIAGRDRASTHRLVGAERLGPALLEMISDLSGPPPTAEVLQAWRRFQRPAD